MHQDKTLWTELLLGKVSEVLFEEYNLGLTHFINWSCCGGTILLKALSLLAEPSVQFARDLLAFFPISISKAHKLILLIPT